MIEKKADELAKLLKSISHPIRLKILCLLLDGEQTVGQIRSVLKTSNANISQHLTILRNQGIISFRKDANFIYNHLNDKRIVKLIETLRQLYC